MADIYYIGAIRMDGAGIVDEIITSLAPDASMLAETKSEVAAEAAKLGWKQYQLALWKSQTLGERREADGKDKFRHHLSQARLAYE